MKLLFLLLTVFCLLNSFPEAQAKSPGSLKEQLSKALKELKDTSKAGSPLAPTCIGELESCKNFGAKKIINENGQEFEISHVSLEYAKELFDEMASQKHIPFKYPEDGCYARAHEMSILLEKMGIISGKVFVQGNLKFKTKYSPKGYVEWWYHVAPFVMVSDEKGEDETYVIDPSMFKKPVPMKEWVAAQTKHKRAKVRKLYRTKRFVYDPFDDWMISNKYTHLSLKDMKKTLEKYKAIQDGHLKLKEVKDDSAGLAL